MVSLFGLSPNMTSLLILLLLVFAVYLFDRKKFKREGIMFLRRTEKGLQFIDSFAKKHPKALYIFGNLGIIFSFGAAGALYLLKNSPSGKKVTKTLFSFLVIFLLAGYALNMKTQYALAGSAFGASGFIVVQLVEGFLNIITQATKEAPLQFVLPIEAPGAPVVSVPIDFWIISIFVILIVHEFAHAFVARAEKVRVKSLGYGFMAVIPLGFAELDDEQLKTTASFKKSRIYAAGSFSNTITAIAALALIVIIAFSASQVYYPAGVRYTETLPGTPAESIFPKQGIITEINGINVSSVSDVSKQMDAIPPGTKISAVIDGKKYEVTAIENPKNASKSFIGISNLENVVSPKKQYAQYFGGRAYLILTYIISLLKWLFLLNLGVGLANLLPLKPLDGGFILEEILKGFFPKSWGTVYYWVASTTLGLILLNLFGVYIVSFLGTII